MNDKCTIYRTADFIGKRWTILILLELYKGDNKWKRYSILKNALPEITPKILSLRLKELESEGMVSRRVDASTAPIKSEYSLTAGGDDFIAIIKEMKQWALKWKFKNKACSGTDCESCIL
ncbi:MAG: helix-turn-helix domain-containing protein [Nanoarchaeota archaeon]|nr:helix-turn-helix domain-containing protein [Nanoarchaeota archaeon]